MTRGRRVRRTVLVRLANRRATAASTAICLLRVLDRRASIMRPPGLLQEPPGDVAVSATPAGAASRPTRMTPHDGAPRWTGQSDGSTSPGTKQEHSAGM